MAMVISLSFVEDLDTPKSYALRESAYSRNVRLPTLFVYCGLLCLAEKCIKRQIMQLSDRIVCTVYALTIFTIWSDKHPCRSDVPRAEGAF